MRSRAADRHDGPPTFSASNEADSAAIDAENPNATSDLWKVVSSSFLFLVVVAIDALALFLSRGRRLRAVGQVGLALVIAGVVLPLVRVLPVRTAVDVLDDDPNNESVAQVGPTSPRTEPSSRAGRT